MITEGLQHFVALIKNKMLDLRQVQRLLLKKSQQSAWGSHNNILLNEKQTKEKSMKVRFHNTNIQSKYSTRSTGEVQPADLPA